MLEEDRVHSNAEVWGEALRDEKRYAIAPIAQVPSPQGAVPVPTCHSVWGERSTFLRDTDPVASRGLTELESGFYSDGSMPDYSEGSEGPESS